jgi:hypothetical protein
MTTGGRAIHVTADTAKLDEIEAMRRPIEQQLGPVDTSPPASRRTQVSRADKAEGILV